MSFCDDFQYETVDGLNRFSCLKDKIDPAQMIFRMVVFLIDPDSLLSFDHFESFRQDPAKRKVIRLVFVPAGLIDEINMDPARAKR